MKKFTKKVMAILLSLTMIFTIAPLSGLAPLVSAATYSGTCGENLTWTLDTSTGVLDITGEGDMYNYFFEEGLGETNVPWKLFRKDIKSVIIGDSVTSIGNWAFENCTKLTSITISDSVTSIGGFAFCDCTGLTSITIPDSVTRIGSAAFMNCTGLTSITIPDSVTRIGDAAFMYCTSLTSITIGNSVTSIADRTFCYCTSLTSITIPDSVTSIGSDAFSDCTSLTSITIPNSVTSIGSYAFYECISLGDVYYNGTSDEWNKISIGSYNSDLTSNLRCKYYSGTCGENLRWTLDTETGVLDITGEGDMTNWSGFSYVPWYSFHSYIKTVNIGNSVTSIGNYAFQDCDSLTSITIPDSVESIGASAFEDSYVYEIMIGKSVKSIGDYAFRGCYLLEDVFYAGSKEDWNKISIGKVNTILIKSRIHYNSDSVHSYTERIVEPTCTEDGYKLCVCECDKVYIAEHIDALGHNYKNGVCVNCRKTTEGISAAISSLIIDKEKNLISGVEAGLDVDTFMSSVIVSDNMRAELDRDIVGTGTKLKVIDNTTAEIIEEYTIVIFGDYNGDGAADNEDASYFASMSNFEIFDQYDNEYLFMAADINGDGSVDSMDEEDMYAVTNFEAYIDYTITEGSKVIRY